MDEKLVKKLYNQIETEGERKGEKYRPFGLYQSSLDSRPNQRYYVECPDGTLVIPPGNTMPVQKLDAAKVLPDNDIKEMENEGILQNVKMGIFI
jgi:adenine-specific DNA-methyltransferase